MGGAAAGKVSGAEPSSRGGGVRAWWWFGWEVEAHEKQKPTVRPQRKESGADCRVKFQIQVNFVGRGRYLYGRFILK
jgi:hypothetical protein